MADNIYSNTPYDPYDEKSIFTYAKKLEGNTLAEVLSREIDTLYSQDFTSFSGKGSFGQYLERDYFKYSVNSDAQPDFFEVGMELKSSPLKKMKNGRYQAKERLVLSIINFKTLVNEVSFQTSSFYKKNAYLLLVLYLHEQGVAAYDLTIHLVGIWKLVGEDLVIIEKDWLFIQNKVKKGLAHELSEGDTMYLGACTKGANAKTLREQPFNEILAKQRAFSYKQSYLNHIIAYIAGQDNIKYGKLLDNLKVSSSIENIIADKFKEAIDNKLTIPELIKKYNLTISPKAKGINAIVTKAILGVNIKQEIEEFVKAGITIRTVRLNDKDLPKECISFPAFEYLNIVEQDWEDSDFYNQVSNKFLFVFLKENSDKEYLIEKVKLWNMSAKQIDTLEQMYYDLRSLILEGTILQSIRKDGVRKTNFPGKKHNGIAHIRPHGRNALDTSKLPVPLKVSGAMEYTKHSFWLNADFVRDAIYYSI